MKSNLRAALTCAVLVLGAGAIASVQAGGRLTAPEPDWTGGVITCKTLQYVLENELDYRVNMVTMPSGPTTVEGIRAGDLDFGCEGWPSYRLFDEKYIKERGGDGSVAKLGEMGLIGSSSYYVPRYVIEGDSARGIPASAPDLKSYKDLNRYKHMFRSLESGDRGSLIGCPVAAWECEDQERLDMLGVDFYAKALGSETAHWAEIQAKYKRGEPFVAYAWEPHWIHAALDLVSIELPPHDSDKWPATTWPKDLVYNYGSPKLQSEHPDAYHVIVNQQLSNEQQAGMIYEVDVKKRDVEEVVAEWMEANEDVWRKWLP
jgi:glycine betaine/proline transport system substrate-binding protein